MDFVICHAATKEWEDAALTLARRLFAVYDEAIDSLALLPTDDDELALYLDGQLVASQRRDGRPPTVAAVRALLAAD